MEGVVWALFEIWCTSIHPFGSGWYQLVLNVVEEVVVVEEVKALVFLISLSVIPFC